MPNLRIYSAAEQVTNHLREHLLRRYWSGTIPGGDRLARQLGVGRMTVETALTALEKEGLLVPQGVGRRRKIKLPKNTPRSATLRVRILLREMQDKDYGYLISTLQQLQHAGFDADFARKSLCDLGNNLMRIERFVTEANADAWIVVSGSLEVLSWFSSQSFPTLSLFGRHHDLPLAAAGVIKTNALDQALARLIELGHQRIVCITRREQRQPYPGELESYFLKRLQSYEIPTGPYNLPEWDNSAEGLERCITSLFRHTPPTAFIIACKKLVPAVTLQLARLGFTAPEHVSLISTQPSPDFEWTWPLMSHFYYDSTACVRCVSRWANHITSGKKYLNQCASEATFVKGGTIGPAPDLIFRNDGVAI